MLFVSDAHVSHLKGNVTPFFDMLAHFETLGEDIVFLGDIFDLWIGIPAYEEAIHHQFLNWVKKASQSVSIAFIEGNHEFFAMERHGHLFTHASTESLELTYEGIRLHLCHGDLINKEDRAYLRFRKVTKNPITKALVTHLPLASRAVAKIKTSMEKKSEQAGPFLPQEAIAAYAHRHFSRGTDYILCGHFHHEYRVDGPNSKQLHVLPDWLNSQKVGRLTANPRGFHIEAWQQIHPLAQTDLVRNAELPSQLGFDNH